MGYNVKPHNSVFKTLDVGYRTQVFATSVLLLFPLVSPSYHDALLCCIANEAASLYEKRYGRCKFEPEHADRTGKANGDTISQWHNASIKMVWDIAMWNTTMLYTLYFTIILLVLHDCPSYPCSCWKDTTRNENIFMSFFLLCTIVCSNVKYYTSEMPQCYHVQFSSVQFIRL